MRRWFVLCALATLSLAGGAAAAANSEQASVVMDGVSDDVAAAVAAANAADAPVPPPLTAADLGDPRQLFGTMLDEPFTVDDFPDLIINKEVSAITLPHPEQEFAHVVNQLKHPLIINNAVNTVWEAADWSPEFWLNALPHDRVMNVQAHHDGYQIYAHRRRPLAAIDALYKRALRTAYHHENVTVAEFFEHTEKQTADEEAAAAAAAAAYEEAVAAATAAGKPAPKRKARSTASKPKIDNAYMYYTKPIEDLPEEFLEHIEPVYNFLMRDAVDDPENYFESNCWVGGRGISTHMHYDVQHNFFSQMYGRKRFLLVGPEQSKYMYLYPSLHPHAQSTQIDFRKLDKRAFPEATKVRAMIAELGPGDMLYVPPGWYHLPTTLSTSFSVSVWSPDRERVWYDKVKALGLPWPKNEYLTSEVIALGMLFLRRLITHPLLADDFHVALARRKQRAAQRKRKAEDAAAAAGDDAEAAAAAAAAVEAEPPHPDDVYVPLSAAEEHQRRIDVVRTRIKHVLDQRFRNFFKRYSYMYDHKKFPGICTFTPPRLYRITPDTPYHPRYTPTMSEAQAEVVIAAMQQQIRTDEDVKFEMALARTAELLNYYAGGRRDMWLDDYIELVVADTAQMSEIGLVLRCLETEAWVGRPH